MTVKQYLEALGYVSADVDANIRAALSELLARRAFVSCPTCGAGFDVSLLSPADRLAMQGIRP